MSSADASVAAQSACASSSSVGTSLPIHGTEMEPSTEGKKRKLGTLKVDEVVRVLTAIEMPDECVALARGKRLSGRVLSYVETAADLPRCGLSTEGLTEFHARALSDYVQEFKADGVPEEYLATQAVPVSATMVQTPLPRVSSLTNSSVRILSMDYKDFEVLQQGHGGLSFDMRQMFGKIGTMRSMDSDGDVRIGDKTYSWNPEVVAVLQDGVPVATVAALLTIEGGLAKLAVGDTVSILRPSVEEARQLMSRVEGGLTARMETLLGRRGKVQSVRDNGDAAVRVEGEPTDSLWSRSLLTSKSLPVRSGAAAAAATSSIVAWRAGMRVRIRDGAADDMAEAQKQHGMLSGEMAVLAGQIGRVVRVESCSVFVQTGRKVFSWNPSLLELPPEDVAALSTSAGAADFADVEAHIGEWRDHSRLHHYCALGDDSLNGATMLCAHGGGVCRQSHWSCCGATSSTTEGCASGVIKDCLLPNTLVRIKAASQWEIEAKKAKHGGVREGMLALAGQVGRVVEIAPQRSYRVSIGSAEHTLCADLLEDVTVGLLSPMCASCSGVMARVTARPSTDSTTQCACCARKKIALDEVSFHCETCRIGVCQLCAASEPGQAVRIVNVTADEMRAKQELRGEFRDVMARVAGRAGRLVRVTEQGDAIVSFDAATRSELGLTDGEGNGEMVFNAELVCVDGARLSPLRAGVSVRVKAVAEQEARRLQSESNAEFTADMKKQLGRLGCVEEAREDGTFVVRCVDKAFAWSAALLSVCDGGTDLWEGVSVKIAEESVDTVKRLQKYHGEFVSGMASWVGQTVEVKSVRRRNNTVVVRAEREGHTFAWNALLIQRVDDQAMSFSEDDVIVRIRDISKEQAVAAQKGHGGFSDAMSEHLGQTGKIVKIDKASDVHVTVFGESFCWNCKLLQLVSPADAEVAKSRVQALIVKNKGPRASTKRSLFSNDDLVQIKDCSVAEVQEAQEDHGGVNPKMLKLLGKTGKVTDIDSHGDVAVRVSGNTFTWNPSMLVLLDNPEHTDPSLRAAEQVMKCLLSPDTATEKLASSSSDDEDVAAHSDSDSDSDSEQ